ncbi:MAG: signal peptide peptidase SppA [Planctomycetes bacterium]|nr:signal peptide peptidase SppA [Planctomycetota bacterium]
MEPQNFPPPPPPPGYMPPPPPGQPGMAPMQGYRMQRPRTGVWRTLGLVLFIGVIGFNLLIFMGMFAGAGMMGGGGDPHGLTERSRQSGSSSKIAVISVEGVIMEGGGGGLFGGGIDPVALALDSLRKAEADDNVVAIILEVNSPGGGVTASDTIHHAILEFKKESGKPVVVYMKDLAASGGYYISAPADHIVAQRTTLTGSIGVIIQGFNFHGTLTEIVKGQDATIKAGGNKAMGNMFGDPESDEYKQGRQLLQDLADEMHGTFKSVVKEGRDTKLKPGWEQYADGRVLSATQAKEIGLIDEIGYFDDAVAAAERLAGVSDATVIEYGREIGLGALFGLNAEELDRMEKAGAMAIEERMSARLQAQLRLYPGQPMAIWVP